MKKNKTKKGNADSLRKQAEKKLGSSLPKEIKGEENSEKLIHELQVHQIELEIQNEELRKAQLVIEESRKKFVDLYDFSPVGYVAMDAKGKIAEANLTISVFLQNDRKFLVGKPLNVYVHKEDKDVFFTFRRSLLTNGDTKSCELRLMRKDNSFFFAHLVGIPYVEDTGSASSFLIAIIDITERIRAEQLQHESEMRFRSLFENMLDGFAYCKLLYENGKPHDFIYLAVNTAFEKLTGLKDVVGKKVSDVIPGIRETNPELFEIYGRVAATGIAERFESYIGGLVIWLKVSVFSNEKDHFVAVFDNITESKRATEVRERLLHEIAENEQRLKNSQAIAHLGSWELDLVNNRLSWSDEVFRIFGLQPQEFGATYEAFLETVHPDDRRAADEAFSSSLREGRDTFEIEHRIVRKSTGEIRKVYTKCEHIRDTTGRIIRTVGMVHDITERAKMEEDLRIHAEQLASANKDLEAFSYSASHDLRAPLQSIIAFGHLLQQDSADKLSKEALDFLNRITGSAAKMAQIIQDLLNLSRISRQEVIKIEVDLSDIAKSIIADLRHEDPQRNIEIVIHDSLKAHADPRMLNVALTNLLNNAWKYTRKTEHPRIEFGRLIKDNDKIFFVKDNGAGFSMAFLGKLFKPFQRLHSDSQFPGIGIGLAIVERVITKHGGRIWAEAEVGKGATFFFTLP